MTARQRISPVAATYGARCYFSLSGRGGGGTTCTHACLLTLLTFSRLRLYLLQGRKAPDRHLPVAFHLYPSMHSYMPLSAPTHTSPPDIAPLKLNNGTGTLDVFVAQPYRLDHTDTMPAVHAPAASPS